MTVWLYAAALALCAGEWYAVARASRPLEWVFKGPALAVLLLAAWLQTAGPHDERAAPFALLALALSLFGDIILLLPGGTAFVAGLGAFLLAHLAYSVALLPGLPPLASLVVLLAVGTAGWRLMRGILRGLAAGGNEALRGPVLAYGVVISLMLFAALCGLFRDEWTPARRVATAAGALLFYASDALLAWGRFVGPLRQGSLVSIVCYHLGQMMLAASFAL